MVNISEHFTLQLSVAKNGQLFFVRFTRFFHTFYKTLPGIFPGFSDTKVKIFYPKVSTSLFAFFTSMVYNKDSKNESSKEKITMRIIKAKDYDDMSRKAANIMASVISLDPSCTLGLATGSTPIGLYKNLIAAYENGNLDFSKVHSINLDEYKGLSGDNDQSYRYFMNHNLFDHVNIDKANTNVPNGLEPDSDKACEAYNEIIHAEGGIDIQLLGLGRNGHIGFNEPCDHFPKETHCVDLTASTIDANKRFFEKEEDVPRQAYTMGIQTIMQAKKVLLVASGADKADALAKTIEGPVTPEVPASILQFHPDVTIVADEAALSLVKGNID